MNSAGGWRHTEGCWPDPDANVSKKGQCPCQDCYAHRIDSWAVPLTALTLRSTGAVEARFPRHQWHGRFWEAVIQLRAWLAVKLEEFQECVEMTNAPWHIHHWQRESLMHGAQDTNRMPDVNDGVYALSSDGCWHAALIANVRANPPRYEVEYRDHSKTGGANGREWMDLDALHLDWAGRRIMIALGDTMRS